MMDNRRITDKKAKEEIKQVCVELKGKSFLEVTVPEIVNALNIPREQVVRIFEGIGG